MVICSAMSSGRSDGQGFGVLDRLFDGAEAGQSDEQRVQCPQVGQRALPDRGKELQENPDPEHDQRRYLDQEYEEDKHGREHASASLEVALGFDHLEELDIVVRDLERGIIDFPSLLGGEEIYLCWLVGEPSVGHWHAVESGFGGRKPLD